MPGLPEEMYCSEQIHIPPTLPYIIRQFAKAAIRTQPKDLLRWSCAYFRSMADGMEPPTKVRLEYPIPKNYMGITPGFLRVLLKQFGKVSTVQWSTLLRRWTGICLQEDDLIKLLLLGKFDNANEIPWLRFIAVAAGHLNDNLSQTMIMLCELLTDEPEGGSAMISVHWFVDLYCFLANIDASEQQTLLNRVFSVSPDLEYGVSLLSRQPERPPSEGFDVGYDSRPAYSKPDDATSYADGVSTITDAYTVVSAAQEVPADTISKSPELTLTNEEGVESTIDTLESAESSSEQTAPTTPRSNTSQIVEQLSDEITELSRKNDELIIGRCHLFEKTIALVNLIGRSTLERTADLSEISTPTDGTIQKKLLSDTTTLYRSEAVTDEYSAIEIESKKVLTAYEKYFIEPVKGIGPIVSNKRQEKFIKYIKERAAEQHAMVMPRNLRHFLCPPMEDYQIEEEDTMWLSYQFEGGRCHMYEKTLALIQLIGSEMKDGGRCYMFEKTIALVYWISRRNFVPGGRCHLYEKSIALVYLIAKTPVAPPASRLHQYEVTLAYVQRIAQEGPAKGGRCHMYEKTIAYVQMLGKADKGGNCHLFEKTIALVQLISIGRRAASL